MGPNINNVLAGVLEIRPGANSTFVVLLKPTFQDSARRLEPSEFMGFSNVDDLMVFLLGQADVFKKAGTYEVIK